MSPPDAAQSLEDVRDPPLRSILRSMWVWASVSLLILLWLPLLAVIRVFDRDPALYSTGLWFRRLGRMMTKVNPSWHLRVEGEMPSDPRNPYVVVSNHQSMADIPLLSNLPWEMKWIGKIELFRLPYLGWMMRLARDIPVDRGDRRSGAAMLLKAIHMLKLRCSVMFFPEGTRSPDGRVWRFNEGAFHIAVKAQVPVLPIAVEGSYRCLPKKSWRFGSFTGLSIPSVRIWTSPSLTGTLRGGDIRLRENTAATVRFYGTTFVIGQRTCQLQGLHRLSLLTTQKNSTLSISTPNA